ncbi:MAG: hypothetical protein GWN97_08360, partial [Thermoplasmata archaeon]|nr:hypothetical protein [Thermoplasmata archaeon]NIT77020.1 hypothetical protein [Thermoplasmata archaeon]NIY03391.1 hypothetical protein [Thermoplasmata archaeon]
APKDKKDKAPKDKAPKEPKGERADWMAAAGKALTKFKSIDKAAEEALKTYLANGGRKVANVKANARMSVSRAVRALAAFGVLELSEDGSKITTK